MYCSARPDTDPFDAIPVVQLVKKLQWHSPERTAADTTSWADRS